MKDQNPTDKKTRDRVDKKQTRATAKEVLYERRVWLRPEAEPAFAAAVAFLGPQIFVMKAALEELGLHTYKRRAVSKKKLSLSTSELPAVPPSDRDKAKPEGLHETDRCAGDKDEKAIKPTENATPALSPDRLEIRSNAAGELRGEVEGLVDASLPSEIPPATLTGTGSETAPHADSNEVSCGGPTEEGVISKNQDAPQVPHNSVSVIGSSGTEVEERNADDGAMSVSMLTGDLVRSCEKSGTELPAAYCELRRVENAEANPSQLAKVPNAIASSDASVPEVRISLPEGAEQLNLFPT
jgi:hypothetical protein